MNFFYKMVNILVLLGITIIFSLIKINFLVGGWGKCFFSGINCILPVTGAIMSFPVAGILVFSFFVLKNIFCGGILTLGLPTLVATLNMSLDNASNFSESLLKFLFQVVLPITCIFLFIIHPVGQKAFLYSFYWFIPLGIYFWPNRSFFFVALSSTFLAHAVGSVIWLYIVPMTSEQWINLIPLVIVERLIFACGMSVTYHLSRWILRQIFWLTKKQKCMIRCFCSEFCEHF